MQEEVLAHDTDEDLYPKTKDAHDQLITRVNDMFTAADEARRPHYDRWKRYYRQYRSFQKRKPGSWQSRVFIPIVFYTIESVLPRVTAALPGMLVFPVGEEDVPGAESMENLLRWCGQRSGLDLELVTSTHDALTYGTGILKTMHARIPGTRIDRVPQMRTLEQEVPLPVIDPQTQLPVSDVDGNEMLEHEMQPVVDPMTGEPLQVPVTDEAGQPVVETRRSTFDLYNGPAAQALDIAHVWVAPEATSFEDARYVIHRVIRDRDYVEKKIEEKVFRWPDHLPEGAWSDEEDDPAVERMAEVELDGGRRMDMTRKAVELWEIWVGDIVMTIANRSRLLRIARNPFAHGQKPFIRIVDHLVPHEFYGIGEVEVLEGVQDVINAMTNQRIDNVRLLLNAMFMVDTQKVKDLRELQMRPGGVISVSSADGRPLDELVKRLDLGDVTSSAYTEVAEMERIAEKVTGTTGASTGADLLTGDNDTATGMAISAEQGGTRFTHKTRIAELTGYRKLVQHFGTIAQQFMPSELVVRVQGPEGQFDFKKLTPEDIQGSFDYEIEPLSTTQTESMRQQQQLSLFQMLGNDPYMNPLKIREDLLKKGFGIKDVTEHMKPLQQLMAEAQQAEAEAMAAEAGIDPAAAAPMGAMPVA